MSNTKHDELFGIASDVEGVSIELERVWNILQIYEDELENEVRVIKPDALCSVEVFLCRFGLLRSQLEAIVILLRSCREDLRTAVDKSYEFLKKEKEAK